MGGIMKWWYPEIIHFNRIFRYKPTILGIPHLWKPPYTYVYAQHLQETWFPAASGSEKLTRNQPYRQTDKQTDSQTGRQVDR